MKRFIVTGQIVIRTPIEIVIHAENEEEAVNKVNDKYAFFELDRVDPTDIESVQYEFDFLKDCEEAQ